MKALICGISGQDGSYLSQLLLQKGYKVYGTSRDVFASEFRGLHDLGIKNEVELLSMDITDFRSVMRVVNEVKPNEIYNLAGQTSVGLSFEQPVEAMESIGNGTLNLLEVIRFIDPSIRFYNASSSECFGETLEAANEDTPFKPCSPYGVAKATSHFLVQNYRQAYKLYASSGILFNHESPLRPERFVTQKIVLGAAKISRDKKIRLQLGSLSIARDWGWAPDYVDAMWRILQQDNPDDFVVATGQTISLAQFAEKAFSFFNLDWNSHVDVNQAFTRPSDIKMSRANPAKAKALLNWTPSKDIDGVIEAMCSSAQRIIDN